jgi:hypothetical protein
MQKGAAIDRISGMSNAIIAAKMRPLAGSARARTSLPSRERNGTPMSVVRQQRDLEATVRGSEGGESRGHGPVRRRSAGRQERRV